MFKKIVILLSIVTVFLSCFTSCKFSDKIDIGKVKYLYLCEDQSLVVVSWVTTQPAKCSVYFCTSDNTCIGIDPEDEFDTLHLVVLPSSNDVYKYTIIATNEVGQSVTQDLVSDK